MKAVLAVLLLTLSAAPCLWDSDTLDTELRGLPEAFDLVVGRWHRHSDAFYEHRIAQLVDKQSMQLADYDDLAVAYEHLQKPDEAIAVMQSKAAVLAASPDKEHQYRYHANLGTFYAHQGKFEDALVELKTAIKINPAAHFGRERFQIALIEYVAAARQAPVLWGNTGFLWEIPKVMSMHSLARISNWTGLELTGEFWNSVGWDAPDASWQQAHQAVAGMLRFGGREGAELYRALGDLYLSEHHLNLAWWAYGHAIERGHPASDVLRNVRRGVEGHWNESRIHHNTGHANPTHAEYEQVRRSADEWLAEFQRAEVAAIARGEEVSSDEALRTLLATADQLVPRVLPRTKIGFWSQFYVALALLMLLACLLKWLDKQAAAIDTHPRDIPPLWLLAAILVMVPLHLVLPIGLWLPGPWHNLGWIAVALGVALVLDSALRCKRLGTGVRPFSEAITVVATGAFRWTRNPMYLGMVVVTIGVAIRLGSVSALLPPVLLFLVLDRRFVRREERFLQDSLGEAYEEYRGRVKRWL